ncbi:alpha/beta hydrolase [Amycolatopsis cihanbeyliensis]|uniref:Acetyl esterase n=1 Tax=Amycolatopsis cihanbeyliensis TaxID=1128664 RepID=A0A542CSG5_AMYCI|nr:alpha/beta hydrolase [Amycolatopsis cihanbeyliensis]TQI93763.1 acetyl esterase [Amycolatopsis cihanbeyliensis]
MPLHPEARAVIAEGEAAAATLEPGALSPAEMRERFARSWRPPRDPAPVGDRYERDIPGPGGNLRIRVYRPVGEGPFPALVWFHGGGWVIGSLDENEATCRALCRGAEVVVISVDYRLAPEHPFPAAAEDAFAAVCWVAGHGAELAVDSRRIAVGGESAGGNLAAVSALMARDHGGPGLVLQLLASPVTAPPSEDRASYRDFAEGYFLSKASMDWFFEQYPRSAADLVNPYLAPLAAEDLGGLPPALVLTAEYDPLRDEGEEYAHRLLTAGVLCELARYPGQIHGFFALLTEQLSISAVAHERAVSALRRAFGSDLGTAGKPLTTTEGKV